MKLVLIIISLLSVLFGLGQESYNKMTENGQKTGQWIELYPNGKVYLIEYYVPVSRKLKATELFFHKIPQNKDSTIYYEVLKWTEKYEYNDDWSLKRIKRIDNIHEKVIYFYGVNKEITLSNYEFNFTGKVGDKHTIEIELINNTDTVIFLKPKVSSTNFIIHNPDFYIPARENKTFSFELLTEPDKNSYTITMQNDSITIDFYIAAFGYHLSSKEIEKGEKVIIKNNFVYYRTGNEALLKIYDFEKKNELKTISLAKEKTIVYLSNIENGNYFFCIINYSSQTRNYCEVKIEKNNK